MRTGQGDGGKTGIIGGMFGLPEFLDGAGRRETPFRLDNAALLANGRSAIHVLLGILKPRRVFLPAYLCPSIIAAVHSAGVPFRFFAMTYDLEVVAEGLDDLGAGDLLLLIDYFGFPADRKLMQQARAAGAWVLEDACQAFFTRGVGECADFSLYSPRKSVGVPDGGILVSHRADVDLDEEGLAPPPLRWWLLSLDAVLRRREFDLHGGDRTWFAHHKKLAALEPVGPFRMSDMSRMLLASIDHEQCARKRIENYRVLLANLPHVPLFPDLPAGVVPLGFPVRVGNRAEMLDILYDAGVYPPVHWDFAGSLPTEFTESYRLLGNIMMLPCDQRYGPEDMLRIVSLMRGGAVPAPE